MAKAKQNTRQIFTKAADEEDPTRMVSELVEGGTFSSSNSNELTRIRRGQYQLLAVVSNLSAKLDLWLQSGSDALRHREGFGTSNVRVSAIGVDVHDQVREINSNRQQQEEMWFSGSRQPQVQGLRGNNHLDEHPRSCGGRRQQEFPRLGMDHVRHIAQEGFPQMATISLGRRSQQELPRSRMEPVRQNVQEKIRGILDNREGIGTSHIRVYANGGNVNDQAATTTNSHLLFQQQHTSFSGHTMCLTSLYRDKVGVDVCKFGKKNGRLSIGSKFNWDNGDESLNLKLSSSSGSDRCISTEQLTCADSINNLSVKVANVASLWLEFLYEDTKQVENPDKTTEPNNASGNGKAAALGKECAIRAAAASMYPTCKFVMKPMDVSSGNMQSSMLYSHRQQQQQQLQQQQQQQLTQFSQGRPFQSLKGLKYLAAKTSESKVGTNHRVLLTPYDDRVLASQALVCARKFAEAGIAEDLVEALHEGITSPSLVVASIALKALAVNDEICKFIAEHGGIDATLRCIDDSGQQYNKVPAKACCSLLSKLAGSDVNKNIIVQKGGLHRFLALASKFSEEPSILQELMAIISALSLRSSQTAALTMEAGAGDVVSQAMQKFPSAPQLQRQSCFMIRNLVVRNPENRTILLGNGIKSHEDFFTSWKSIKVAEGGDFDFGTLPSKTKGFKLDKFDFKFNGPGGFDLGMDLSKEKKSEKSNECGKEIGITPGQSVLIEPISENIRFFIWPRTGWREMSFSVVVSEIAVSATGFLVIAVDGKFSGPVLNVTTNYNVVVNVLNNLDEELLITWAGIQQRKNSWQHGVLGTNCPIPSGWNWTYQFQVKDQMSSFIYFPSLGFRRAVGGYGGITINNRAVISVPFGQPDPDDYPEAANVGNSEQGRVVGETHATPFRSVSSSQYEDCMLKAKKCLKREKERVAHYLYSSSEKEHSGCIVLLRNEKVDDLLRIYQLFSKIDHGLELVARIFKEHVTDGGMVLVKHAENQTSNKKVEKGDMIDSLEQIFVAKVIDLHDKDLAYVTDFFKRRPLFHKALREAFEVFCNKGISGSTKAELLAVFCDNILNKGGGENLSDESIEETLEKVVQLLACTIDKDLFSEFYRKKLTQLLFDRRTNDDHERSILTKLKQQCGGRFTSEMGYSNFLEQAYEVGKMGNSLMDSRPLPSDAAAPVAAGKNTYVLPSLRGGADRSGADMIRWRNDENSVRVTNRSEDTHEPNLLEFFLPFGHVTRVYVAVDQKTGISRELGFVNFQNKEDAERAIESNLQHKRECANQILKAAMTINSNSLAEMEIPDSYFESLPKNGRASLGDVIYRYIISEQFYLECLRDCLDFSSKHQALEVGNRVEASVYVWRRRAINRPASCANQTNTNSSWARMKELMADAKKRKLLADRVEGLSSNNLRHEQDSIQQGYWLHRGYLWN